ncbi:teichoic acid transport system ATP-binding protein [Sediminihabitans luteus]|uniref:Teichoic acid transport system ATP-binding protein n=1 Tax=Sediminihabitans luteus TaxID=1138585 RepID=A0A2M9CE47_9CELL|nr:ABC transporter ATP-binding protein [Sediminihabitans luteus]PJJ70157.1 teichoic acid transport system ATP-binding protein [Sediminihabitans luteus]GII97628.1 polysaccharide ABC transporter ATP-binding protein [Sediminihabitans luteus]
MPWPDLVDESATVVVDDLSMRYHVTADADEAGLGRTARTVRALVGRGPSMIVRAISSVSFVAHGGEQIGIVGQNGSGKSTLLRVVAGLERPSRGRVLATSQPVLIGVNAALQPELSGAQNIRLGCLAMGLDPDRARAAVPEVAELADLGDAIRRPMKSYSSGMAARLRFAIATAANPHILLIDEALATGDAAFRERSEARMEALRRDAGTVFLVSHAARTIEETCTRALWLEHGRVVLDGPAADVALRYRRFAWALAKNRPNQARKIIDAARQAHEEVAVHVLRTPAPRGIARHARPRVRPRTPAGVTARTREEI